MALWFLLLALPARALDLEVPPSDHLNERLPVWLRLGGEARTRFEGFTGSGFRHSSNDLHLLTRVRVDLTVRPWRRLAFFAQTQDARVAGTRQVPAPASYQDAADLRMAYFELGDRERDPLTVRAGRQELNFGEQRLVGATSGATPPSRSTRCGSLFAEGGRGWTRSPQRPWPCGRASTAPPPATTCTASTERSRAGG